MTVEPIREIGKINQVKMLLASKLPNHAHVNPQRNRFLFILGINCGLRISDIVGLKIGQVYGVTHIRLTEKKTGKKRIHRINAELQIEIEKYLGPNPDPEGWLIQGESPGRPLTRQQAYNIVHEALKAVGVSPAGTHSLRKTFGYHFYQRFHDVAMLQLIFNHSSPAITLRYIGIQQDMIDEKLQNFAL